VRDFMFIRVGGRKNACQCAPFKSPKKALEPTRWAFG
jgi:hypothetical protein